MFLHRSLVVLLAASLALTACDSQTGSSSAETGISEVFGDSNADGEALANAWFELLSLTGSSEGITEVSPEQAVEGAKLVRPYLDPAFQLQRATGQRHTRDDYVPSDIDEFEISNVRETVPREGLKVLRYSVATIAATALDQGVVMSDELAPRLTVVRWDQDLGRWLIVSHANFNTPVQAVCNQKPITMESQQVQTPESDRELGESLARTWFDLLVSGDGSPLMHPQVQGQVASGSGYTTAAEYTPGQMKAAELSDFVVTRNDDVVVVTLVVEAQGTVFANSEVLGTNLNPRLLTFLDDGEGDWKLISVATFNPPAEVPKDVDCA
jgi:hypothetical protein